MKKIQNIFLEHINEPINKIEQITHGVTNNTYLISTNNNKYILRISGKGTNSYINRINEIENMRKISTLNILPHIYYADEQSGTIISQYIDIVKEFKKNDLRNLLELSKLNQILIQLHSSHLILNNEFNIKEKIMQYQQQLSIMNCDYPGIIKDNIFLLQNAFERLQSRYKSNLVPCHNDPKMDNFLLTDKKIYLIDWEYSGMADEYFEMANFTLTNELDIEEEKLFLNNYIQLSNMNFIEEKYILYKIVTDYLWIFWHLIKLNQKQNVEYNERKWKERLFRSLKNIEYWEEKFK